MNETDKNSMSIGIGVSLMIYGTISGIVGTIKMVKDNNIQELSDKKVINKIKTGWRYYIPTVVATITGAGCIVHNSTKLAKANSALTIAANIAENALETYQKKVTETLGEKRTEKIDNDICDEQIEKNPPKIKVHCVSDDISDTDNVLVYDRLSDRYFESNKETIRSIINDLNARMLKEMCISKNDYFYEIGLKPTPDGDYLGWNINRGFIEIKYGNKVVNNMPCLTLTHLVPPRSDYTRV